MPCVAPIFLILKNRASKRVSGVADKFLCRFLYETQCTFYGEKLR
jgi:hypothetical protein